MNKTDFMTKIAALPTAEPDGLDRAMLSEMDSEYDPSDSGDFLEHIAAKREYNGKILLRVPRELHAELVETAKTQGVSLNQYCLYKLAR
jgi:hypothetical protein